MSERVAIVIFKNGEDEMVFRDKAKYYLEYLQLTGYEIKEIDITEM